MKKKLLSLLIVAGMTASLCAGCGSTQSASTAETGSASESSEASSSQATESGDPTHIVMEFIYFDAVPRDLEEVEAAINEKLIPEYNIELELYPLAYSDAFTQASLMISSGEQLDIAICPDISSLQTLVNQNMLLELDDLYEEYGQDIAANASVVVSGGIIDNTLYAIPKKEFVGHETGIIANKEVVDAVGLTDYSDMSLEDLDDYFAKAKELYPDKYMLHLAGGAGNVTTYDNLATNDYLGADAACGGILGVGEDEGNEIVNVFASEDYMNVCKKIREWYLAGYINADAATSTDSGQAAVVAGTATGYFMSTSPGMVSNQAAANGVEAVGLVTATHVLTQSDLASGMMVIPYSCENPEAAMQIINLCHSDADFQNLLVYGIEGLDYQVLDDGRFYFLDGDTAQTIGYHSWFDNWYAQLDIHAIWGSNEVTYKDEVAEYNNAITSANSSKYLGYTFNPDTVKTQYAAVTDVCNTYRTSLESGVVDPEEVIPEFVAALEAAGINDIIAANQAALDEWIASNQ